MADEEKQKTEQGSDQRTPLAADQARIAELQGLLTGKTAELTRAAERLMSFPRCSPEKPSRSWIPRSAKPGN
jgi:hypothetical protein